MNTITTLKENEVFVFGSNLLGRHAGGAALYAKEHFGAEEGAGEGITGQCYALPTLNKKLKRFDGEHLTMHVRKFFRCARENPDKLFLLTKVGCGIAGYDENYIKTIFKVVALPPNVVLPIGWKGDYPLTTGK